jgi:hypothetical protein
MPCLRGELGRAGTQGGLHTTSAARASGRDPPPRLPLAPRSRDAGDCHGHTPERADPGRWRSRVRRRAAQVRRPVRLSQCRCRRQVRTSTSTLAKAPLRPNRRIRGESAQIPRSADKCGRRSRRFQSPWYATRARRLHPISFATKQLKVALPGHRLPRRLAECPVHVATECHSPLRAA